MIPQVSIPEFVAARQQPTSRVIDVREQWEYVQGHVPGATWLPMSMVTGRVDDFRGEPPTYVICRTGNRSGQVVMWLARQGIEAINVAGGTVAWQQAGGAVVTGTEPGTVESATSAKGNPA